MSAFDVHSARSADAIGLDASSSSIVLDRSTASNATLLQPLPASRRASIGSLAASGTSTPVATLPPMPAPALPTLPALAIGASAIGTGGRALGQAGVAAGDLAGRPPMPSLAAVADALQLTTARSAASSVAYVDSTQAAEPVGQARATSLPMQHGRPPLAPAPPAVPALQDRRRPSPPSLTPADPAPHAANTASAYGAALTSAQPAVTTFAVSLLDLMGSDDGADSDELDVSFSGPPVR